MRLRASATHALVLWVGFLAGCASAPSTAVPPVRLLLFGDHGYDLDYLERKEREPVRTLAEAVENERKKWLDDKRPPAEFAPPMLAQLPSTGGYVPASGMMRVASSMLDYCRSHGCDSGVMLGDNVYPNGPTMGADGVPDSKRFEDIFLAPFRDFTTFGAKFRIYSALGNHDWRTNREAALGEVRYLETTPPFFMNGLFYSAKNVGGGDDVELFILDTTVLLAGTTVYEDHLADDGSELPPSIIEKPRVWTVPATDEERNMVSWLERSLRESRARWKIVAGHHPLWSSAGGKYEEARAMRRLLLPVLCRYADFYLAGHEHTLELHSDSCAAEFPGASPLPQIISGAAAKQRPLNSWFVAHQKRKSPQLTTHFAKGLIWGYAHLTLDAETATIRMIRVPNEGAPQGEVLHRQTFRRRSAQTH